MPTCLGAQLRFPACADVIVISMDIMPFHRSNHSTGSNATVFYVAKIVAEFL
ncbi:MAG: hypothetical protein ACYTEU_14050 [Planctomycetota bacterium]